MTEVRVDYEVPGWTPPIPLRCDRCDWTELRDLGQLHPTYILARPCEEHR